MLIFQNIILEDIDKNDVLRQKRGGYDKQYSFDMAFGEDSTQEQVYEATTSSLVQDVLNGLVSDSDGTSIFRRPYYKYLTGLKFSFFKSFRKNADTCIAIHEIL